MKTTYDDELTTKAVYAAEDAVGKVLRQGGTVDFHGSTLLLPSRGLPEYSPMQLPLMQGMVDGLWRAHGGHGPSPVLVHNKRAARKAWYSPMDHTISLPNAGWAWNPLVLCHELAHALAGTGHDQRSSHGHRWRAVYASLVRDAVSPEASLLLMDALALD